MSRIGNRIITVPTGVTVEETNGVVTVKGPKGSLSQPMLKDITMKVEENKVVFITVGFVGFLKMGHLRFAGAAGAGPEI